MSFLDRPRPVWLRRVLFQIHLWVGIVAALYVLVVSVTGAALVFRIHLQRAAHPELLTASADGPIADIATVLERVRAAYPSGRVSGVDAPTRVRPTHLAYVADAEQFRTVLIDPVTASVLGELPERSAVRTLQDLHFNLLAGPVGLVVNGVGSLCLLLLCLTGLVVWWPGRAGWRRGFTIDWRRPWKRVTWELHSAVGIWTIVLTGIWAVTGVYFAFPGEFRAAVTWISPLTVSDAPSSRVRGAEAMIVPTWRELIDRARAVAPDAFVARVVVPATETAPFQVLFSDDQPTPVGSRRLRTLYLDQVTGAILTPPTPPPATVGDTIMAWAAPLHVGSFGGLPVRIVWFITGLAPGVLAATGLILWWTRVVSPRWLTRRGMAPARVPPPASEPPPSVEVEAGTEGVAS